MDLFLHSTPLFASILVWKPPEGLNPSQALDLLQKRLEKLGGKSLGTWTVDCETLQSAPTLGTVTQLFCVSLVTEFWLGPGKIPALCGLGTRLTYHVASNQTSSSHKKEELSAFFFVPISI